MDLQNLRQHIEQSNKQIHDLQTELEFMKRAHKGSIASEDMIIQLRQKELEYA